MLSDNIRNLRKINYMSQDELAEKLGVSRQSVSLWENGQTQPTIDNIIAMAKIFNVSSDTLLESSENKEIVSSNRKKIIIPIVVAGVVIIAAVTALVLVKGKNSEKNVSDYDSENVSAVQSENSDTEDKPSEVVSESGNKTESSVKSENTSKTENTNKAENKNKSSSVSSNDGNKETSTEKQFDLFEYCKNFAIKKGTLNGDYCIYQQTSSKYGGRSDEYFSITYWSDSNMVEFCLHCPLNETYSENFYLRMRGGYNKKYEYLSSLYYRDNGESLRSATGYIDPSVFYDGYPISCDRYEGSSDKRNDFMEESRVGICDLIRCLKEFVSVENMECDFSVFDFVNF